MDVALALLLVFCCNTTGPYTLWDGNHRAAALYGYFRMLERRHVEGPSAATLSDLHALDNAHVRLYVGQSQTIWRGHKGTFYCPTEGL